LRNQTIHVLNDALEPCPVWVAGHIHIGGIGLAQGYWQDAGKSAASFPIHPRTGERLYRTGDLGRWLPDGNVEFLGREDFQVKIQGYRIELGEIEAALNRHEGVADSVVLAIGERQEGKRLAAFVVGRGDAAPDSEALRAFLRHKLPDYMVPTTFAWLDAFPLSVNGKVDRKALTAQASAAQVQALVAPRTDTEEALAVLVQRTLGVEQVGVETNFFEMGFDSLQGTALVTAIRQSFEIDLPLRAFFEAPTIARLAQVIEDLILAEIEELSDDEALAQVQAMAGDESNLM
jgi:acyl carrier protein